jgi:hypothetical protein
LAICEKGVWDKGGEASGIRVDSEAVGEPTEKVTTVKPDGEYPEPSLPIPGAGDTPAPPQQGIPPGLLEFANNLNRFADRLDGFVARKDLMVR